MKIFDNLSEWLQFRSRLKPNATLGFVPTMGNLHQGHLSLVQKSLNENDYTLISIFINPKQFNQPEDFKHYPRTLETDLALLQNIGVDYVLLPSEEELYAYPQFSITEQPLSQLMEGFYRPGHFEGVLTIVMILFNLVKPQRAYFGEKDYQQYLLICKMAAAFFMNITIIACPTIREPSGLAYSSRNNLLSPRERQTAEHFALLFQQEKPLEVILKELKAASIEVDYLIEYEGRRYIAVKIGTIRLIDNYALKINSHPSHQ